MARNTTVAVEVRKQELLDAELAKFMETALGGSLRSPPRFAL
jgi:hypothetical protein